ncbi:hypothetical protein [uncultured Sphingomonas sp.]|uniref:hypothetical protein n=1 Tax=uncultured Sphingomonas sp. TaxID=158754 RepID=UPI0025CD8873|nr:hypothetical protein [uncultured Sphingomonas sp.]
MPKRRAASRPRRSVTEWAVRGALAVAAAGLGTLSVAHSLGYMIRGSDPRRAHALAPWDGRITALLSEQLSGPGASATDRNRADDLARLALRQDPTAVPAVATLGIDAQVRGDSAGARRIFAYSEMLSRRDLRTRLWAIEDGVARNDIPGVLRNYDIALRTSRIAPDLLFPVLASAIGDTEIRQELVATMARRPMWNNQFLGFMAGNGSDARATASLFEALHRRRIMLPQGAAPALVSRLLAEQHLDDAWRFYAVITPGVDRRIARDPDFTANPASPTPFDWQPVIDSGVSATIQRGEKGGIFDFAVPPNLGGPVLRQAQLLPPGDYSIEGSSIGIEQADAALPYWTLTCPDGRELGRVVVPNSAQVKGRFAGRFTVPAGCPVQQLQLVARPSDALSGVTGQVDNVRLRPVSR